MVDFSDMGVVDWILLAVIIYGLVSSVIGYVFVIQEYLDIVVMAVRGTLAEQCMELRGAWI